MPRWLDIRFRRTTVLMWGCVGVLAGLWLGRTFVVPASLLVLSLLLLPLAMRRTSGSIVLVVVGCLTLGMWRSNVVTHMFAAYNTVVSHKVVLQVTALEDGVYGRQTQMVFSASNIHIHGRQLPGRIQVSGFGVNAVYQGDVLLATGKLSPGNGASQGRMSFAKLQLLGHHRSAILQLRQRFDSGLISALPEPLGSFGMGILIGQRSGLPPDVKQLLLEVGLTHVIAVSGYNLTIMLHASRRLLAAHSKRLNTALSLVLIAAFVLITGASASIVRAAVVSILSMWASYYGRSIRPVLLLLLVAAGTALCNPVYVWADASWYLSFLAFAGIMVLAPLLEARLPRRFAHSTIAMVALESICAEAATLPYLLHTFGQMSLVGLPANILIVSVVPLAMAACLAAGLAGMFVGILAGWFAWPAVYLLSYMLSTSSLLQRVPHHFQVGLSLNITGMLILYAALGMLCWLLSFKKHAQSGTITDKNSSLSPLFERMHIV